MSTIADKYSIKAYLQPRPEPQKPTGSLNESYAYSDLTPIIGREYPNIKLAELLDSDKLLRDLAIISLCSIFCTREMTDSVQFPPGGL